MKEQNSGKNANKARRVFYYAQEKFEIWFIGKSLQKKSVWEYGTGRPEVEERVIRRRPPKIRTLAENILPKKMEKW